MAAPLLQPTETAAPRWDVEAAIARVEERLNRLNSEADSERVDDLYPTLADIIGTRPDRGRCRRSKLTHLSDLGAGVSSTNYRLCKQADCPKCASYWAKQVLRRTFQAWRHGAPLYRAVFATHADLRNSGRGKTLRADHGGSMLRVAVGYQGEQHVYFPGYPGDGDPVLDPATEVLDSLLKTPAFTNGSMRRVQTPRLPRALRDDDRDPDDVTAVRQRVEFAMPKWVMRYEALTVAPAHGIAANGFDQIPGHMLANVLVQRALGRPVEFMRIPYRRGVDAESWTVDGLAEDEVLAVRAALEPLRLIALREAVERRMLRDAAAAAGVAL